MTRRQPAPLDGLSYLQFEEMVRRCLPTAQRLVAWGVTDREGREHQHDSSLSDHLITLLGHDHACDNEDCPYDEWAQAAYALGIAVGLHLRREAFEDRR